MRVNDQRGFTLLELIIVVAILGVIVAIAVPQYNSYRERALTASVTSSCRALYRAFVIFYIENESQYPSHAGYADTLNTTTFYPLSDSDWLGGISFEIDITQLQAGLYGQEGQRHYFSDPDTDWQYYYLVMPWGRDPSTKFVIASSSDVKDKNGVSIDGGNYLDGVFVWKDGQIKFQ